MDQLRRRLRPEGEHFDRAMQDWISGPWARQNSAAAMGLAHWTRPNVGCQWLQKPDEWLALDLRCENFVPGAILRDDFASLQ
jgi:hypothetical protein